MPRLLDTRRRTDHLGSVMAALIDEQGLSAPSGRAIARRLGISIGTLSYHYEHRQRLVEMLAWTITEQFAEDRDVRVRLEGAAGLLPDPRRADTLRLTRAWLAVLELARASDHIAVSTRAAEEQERDLLDQLGGAVAPRARFGPRLLQRADGLAGAPTTGVHELTQALLTGLRTRVCARVDPTSTARAVELLRTHLATQASGAPPAA